MQYRLFTYRTFLTILVLILCTPLCIGENVVDTLSVTVYFTAEGTALNPAYDTNEVRLDNFYKDYNNCRKKGDCRILSIEAVGTTSPLGTFKENDRLPRERSKSLVAAVCRHLGLPQSMVTFKKGSVNWPYIVDGLYGAEIQDAQRAIHVIKNVPELVFDKAGTLVDSRKRQLQNLNRGAIWAWLTDHVFKMPECNSATLTCIVEIENVQSIVIEPEIEVVAESEEGKDINIDIRADEAIVDEADVQTPVVGHTTETVVEPAPETVVEAEPVETVVEAEPVETVDIKPSGPTEPVTTNVSQEQQPKSDMINSYRCPVMALRSNLLLPLLNIGAELPLGNHFSLGADFYCPWAPRKADHKECFQLMFVTGDARYWFGRHRDQQRRLLGHSLGVYGAWGYYDLEHNWHGNQGDFWSAGLSYMLSVPIAKGGLHMEFELAVGYLYSKADPYDVFTEGGSFIYDPTVKKRISYVGPTKVAISLVIPLKRTKLR